VDKPNTGADGAPNHAHETHQDQPAPDARLGQRTASGASHSCTTAGDVTIMAIVSALSATGSARAQMWSRRCHGGTKASHECQQVATSPPVWQLAPHRPSDLSSLSAGCGFGPHLVRMVPQGQCARRRRRNPGRLPIAAGRPGLRFGAADRPGDPVAGHPEGRAAATAATVTGQAAWPTPAQAISSCAIGNAGRVSMQPVHTSQVAELIGVPTGCCAPRPRGGPRWRHCS
jgi:hypothetical protein